MGREKDIENGQLDIEKQTKLNGPTQGSKLAVISCILQLNFVLMTIILNVVINLTPSFFYLQVPLAPNWLLLILTPGPTYLWLLK